MEALQNQDFEIA